MKELLRDQPIGRMGLAAEVASAVLWLCSPEASFVLGVALPLDGGFAAPDFVTAGPVAWLLRNW